jgi:hypothetical protein
LVASSSWTSTSVTTSASATASFAVADSFIGRSFVRRLLRLTCGFQPRRRRWLPADGVRERNQSGTFHDRFPSAGKLLRQFLKLLKYKELK